MANEPVPEDYENYLECGKCFWVCPIYSVEKIAEIKNAIETQESPFDNKFHLESIPPRNSPAVKRASAKKTSKKIKLDDDPEIDSLLKIYGDKVNVLK
jgi:hypothetical protein